MTKPQKYLLVGFAAVLVAIAASTAVAVSGISAETGPGIEFRDDAGQLISEVFLPNPGDSVLVQVHFNGPIDPDVNVAQVSIDHDETVVSVIAPPVLIPPEFPPFCDGAFANAFPGSGRVPGEQASWFLCGISPSVGTPSSGLMMNLLITRVSGGEPTLNFNTNGILPAKLFEPGTTREEPLITYDLVPLGSLAVLEAAPAPTPVPTTPPGGGGAPPPQPTATPSGPVLLVPGAPQNVNATPTLGGVRLNWDAPQSDGDAEITNYRVLVTPIGRIEFVPASQTEATITDLDPALSYRFQINAANSAGTGSASVLTPAVSPLFPLGAPQGITASLATDNVSAVVVWQAPQNTGTGPVTGYTIVSEPAVRNGVEVGPEARSVTFTGLAFNSSYTFRVLASNFDGTGPLSEPSNTVFTGGPGSGSPGDSPALKPAVDASEAELTEFEQAVSGAFGSEITLNGEEPSIRSAGSGLVVEFSVESSNTGPAASGSLIATVGNLSLDITNGSGTATLLVDDQISITGSARLVPGIDSVEIQIDDPQLEFAPAAPENFVGAGGLVMQAGASFGVAMTELPESIGLTARFIDDLAEVPEATTSFQLAAGATGGEIENPAADIAFVVVVDKQGVSNDELGDNTVTLTVSRAWYDNRLADGKEIFITKVGDDGVAHTAAATCQVADGVALCTAVFTGAAGGFSLFGVVAVSPGSGGIPVEPTATTATQATSTPVATPTQAATVTPSPAATADIEPTPTATPLSALQPSPQPDVPVDPDLPESSSGGFPLWASLLIGFVGLVVLVPAAGAGYTFYRRQRAS